MGATTSASASASASVIGSGHYHDSNHLLLGAEVQLSDLEDRRPKRGTGTTVALTRTTAADSGKKRRLADKDAEEEEKVSLEERWQQLKTWLVEATEKLEEMGKCYNNFKLCYKGKYSFPKKNGYNLKQRLYRKSPSCRKALNECRRRYRLHT